MNPIRRTLARPFRGLDNPRDVWAWGMFDLANQSFTLLVNTLLFSLFFKNVIAGGHERGDVFWSGMVAVSMAFVVVLGPPIGAWADLRARKKAALVSTAVICVCCTLGFALLPSSADVPLGVALLIAALVYVPANFAFNLGENFLAAFLPEISDRSMMGRVSAIGWTMGYVGALVLLVLTAGAMHFFGLGDTAEWRPLLVLAGAWFAMMAIPTILFLPERAQPADLAGLSAHRIALRCTRATLRSAREFPELRDLLVAFFVYAFGVQTVIFFASIIASEDFNFDQIRLVLLVLQITLTAGIGAALAGIIQDRLGHLNTIVLYLGVWIVTTLGLAVISLLVRNAGISGEPFPEWPVWLVGNGVGLGLGGIGTTTRATVATFSPKQRTAECFGLWGLSYKLAAIVGPLSFGVVRTTAGSVASLVALAAFFVVGAALLVRVDEREGQRRAAEVEDALSARAEH